MQDEQLLVAEGAEIALMDEGRTFHGSLVAFDGILKGVNASVFGVIP